MDVSLFRQLAVAHINPHTNWREGENENQSSEVSYRHKLLQGLPFIATPIRNSFEHTAQVITHVSPLSDMRMTHHNRVLLHAHAVSFLAPARHKHVVVLRGPATQIFPDLLPGLDDV